MEHRHRYLIVGGGMTAAAAAAGIREVDPDGSIGLIGAEADPPYNRPPLSKGLWKGKPLEKIWCGVESTGAELHLGRTVSVVEPALQRVLDGEGDEYHYEKLLLATGGTPRRLPFGQQNIIYFRTLADYRRLRELADTRERFAVIGGGFIGAEIAAALAMNGKKVTMLFPEAGIGALPFPADLAGFLNQYYRDKGVEVLAGEMVSDVRKQKDQVVIKTQAGRRVAVDGVVAGIGIQPNVELAQAAGLAVENGIVVDDTLRTSRPDIFAAGDVAMFFNPALGKRIRVEHEDNANTMGKMAGRAMAGEAERYHHLPFFYSDLFELGYEAIGELDARLETVADWQEPYQKGVVYYLREGRVRGVLLWNVWEQVEAARKLIAEAGPFTASDLQGRIGRG